MGQLASASLRSPGERNKAFISVIIALKFNWLKIMMMIKPYVVPTGRRVLAMMIDAKAPRV